MHFNKKTEIKDNKIATHKKVQGKLVTWRQNAYPSFHVPVGKKKNVCSSHLYWRWEPARPWSIPVWLAQVRFTGTRPQCTLQTIPNAFCIARGDVTARRKAICSTLPSARPPQLCIFLSYTASPLMYSSQKGLHLGEWGTEEQRSSWLSYLLVSCHSLRNSHTPSIWQKVSG